ncbi:MAG: NAD(P)/FAD-dependent oxidoreductase [Brevinema sp.]
MDLKIDLSSFSCTINMLSNTEVYDLLIIGGGPAAMNAALYASRKKLNLGLITEEVGGQITKSASIENWLGDLDIKSSVLANRFYSHIEKFAFPMKKNTRVVSTELEGVIKKVTCEDGAVYQTKTLIVATGKSPRTLGIPGEAEYVGRGVAYCTTCDGPIFVDKKVVIVGGGNSGIEATLDMLSYAKEVTIVQNLSQLTADPILVEKVLSNSRVNVIYNSECVRIEGGANVERLIVKDTQSNKESSIETDGVFVEIGLLPASAFISDKIKNNIGEILINMDCSTDIPGVFAAGDVTTVPFKQVVIAAGEGAKAALAVSSYLMTEN